MKSMKFVLVSLFTSLTLSTSLVSAAEAELTSEQKIKLEQKFQIMEKLASDPVIIAMTKERNSKTSDELKAMNQDKWKAASVLDPIVRGMTKNQIGEILKKAQASDNALSEAFASAADGTKLGFISKPSNWTHQGKPKHDLPMQGKHWTGPIEVDLSSGLRQLQVAVPIFVDGKPAGSLVFGYQVMKL